MRLLSRSLARADGADWRGPLSPHALAEAALSLASRRGAIILCFHQVEPEQFVRWIGLLITHLRLVTLDELLHRHERRQSLERLLVITFDDGSADTCEPIASICEQRHWPITIYAISSVTRSRGTLWFAEWPALLQRAAGTRIELDGRVLDLTGRRVAAESSRAVNRWLRTLPGEQALRTVERLRARAGLSCEAGAPAPFIDEQFLRRYANSAWISVGSHTVDHQSLSVQGDDELWRQLTESRAVLEEITGRPVVHFCYPYGNPDAIGARAPRLAEQVYRSAVTMVRGTCDHRSSPWYLPRVPVFDTDGDLSMLAKVASADWA